MTLEQAAKGQRVLILDVEESGMRAQAMRLGIYEGAEFVCAEKIKGGPVILYGQGGETAVGKRLSQKIKIKLAQDKDRGMDQ